MARANLEVIIMKGFLTTVHRERILMRFHMDQPRALQETTNRKYEGVRLHVFYV